MAHFFAEIAGQRGPASRLGSVKSGIQATAASWQGAVQTTIEYDEKTGQDMAVVSLMPWHGRGTSRILYRGPVSGAGKFCPTCGRHETLWKDGNMGECCLANRLTGTGV